MSESQGMQGHCCCCASGVLLALLGISLLSTGVSMVINYGAFDVGSLPEGWQNSDGQRNLGIILMCVGVVSLTVSVLVTVLFFTNCNKNRTESDDSEVGQVDKEPEVKSGNANPVQTVCQPDLPNRQHQRHGKGKRGRKKRRKQAPIKLETHHESLEEHYDHTSSRDVRSATKRSSNSARLRDRQRQESSAKKHDENEADLELDTNVSVPHLPPLLIAPAQEKFSTCNVNKDSETTFNEPDVFRVGRESASSQDSSSIVASTSTTDSFRPWPSPRDGRHDEQFDQDLHDILK